MMKPGRRWRWAPVALLMAIGGTAGRAEEFAIRSFDGAGQIVFSAVNGATNYQVNTAPTPTGAWDVAVGTVPPTAANVVTTTVSMASATAFYRVVAFTNLPPATGGLYLVVDLSGGVSAPVYPVSSLDAVPPGGWTDEYKTTRLVLRRIPATTPAFSMGSPANQPYRWSDETQHQVALTKDFYLGVFEVTQRQWELVMGNRPSWFTNATYYPARPVEGVSYYDIRENPTNGPISPNWPQSGQVHADSFMGKLRAKTGLSGFDLPTESQWEYACRAGTTTMLNSGYNLADMYSDARMDDVGRYQYNCGWSNSLGWPAWDCAPSNGTALVGSSLANAWGLYDMHGNVMEWCLDWYDSYPGTVTDPAGPTSASATWGSVRIARGGCYWSDANRCCSASRYRYGPATRGIDYPSPAADFSGFGFRVCCAPRDQP